MLAIFLVWLTLCLVVLLMQGLEALAKAALFLLIAPMVFGAMGYALWVNLTTPPGVYVATALVIAAAFSGLWKLTKNMKEA